MVVQARSHGLMWQGAAMSVREAAMYNTFQVIHVLAATVWVGGAIFHIFASAQMVGASPAVARRWAQLGDAAGQWYYSPAAVVTLLAGIGAVLAGDLDWGEPFISIGFTGIVASLAIGFAWIRPNIARMVAELEGAAPDPTVLAGIGGRIRVATMTNAAVLVVVVWAMVTRPGG